MLADKIRDQGDENMERRIHKDMIYDGEMIEERWSVEGFDGDRWMPLQNGGPFKTKAEAEVRA